MKSMNVIVVTIGWFLVISLQSKGCMKLFSTFSCFSFKLTALLGKPANSFPCRYSFFNLLIKDATRRKIHKVKNVIKNVRFSTQQCFQS